MSKEFKFTDKQREVLDWFSENECECESELTLQLPTGFGKSHIICETMKSYESSVIVFPTLTLLDSFEKKHLSDFKGKLLFICTDMKETDEDKYNGRLTIRGEESKKELLSLEGKSVVLTTYKSFPFVLENVEELDVVYFDEAHHRGVKSNLTHVEQSIDKYRHKINMIVNMSATPSECCNCSDGSFIYTHFIYA